MAKICRDVEPGMTPGYLAGFGRYPPGVSRPGVCACPRMPDGGKLFETHIATSCMRISKSVQFMESANMVTSIILLNIKRNKVNEVAEKLADMEGVSEVYSVTGNYDLVAVVRVKTNDDLANLVTSQLVNVDGIEKTDTMLAFKAYSKHDLDAMFSM